MLPRLKLSTFALGLFLGAASVASAASAAPAADTDTAAASGPTGPVDLAAVSDSAPDHLLGDWYGLRPKLLDSGVNLDVSYTSETAAVVSGGERRGIDYADSIDVKADFDMQKLAGMTGFSLHAAVGERAGRDASSDFLGNYVTQVAEIYGGAGDVGVHLSYVYGEETLLGGAVDIEAGRMAVGESFGTSPLYCNFMSDADCPSPHGLSGSTAFDVYPASSWGARLKISPGDDLAVKVGVYQVRPEYGGRSGFNWSLSQTTGVMLPAELDWSPSFGPDHLVGHYKVGVSYDTSRYADLGVITGPAPTDKGRADWYLLGDQMLKRTGEGDSSGIILLGGYTHSDANTSIISEMSFVGVLASGIVPDRPSDAIGLQVMRYQLSKDLIQAEEAEAAEGLPISSGIDGVPSPGAVQGQQTTIEVNYNIRVMSGFHLMPDFQYVVHPNVSNRYPDATVVGLKMSLNL
jgi:porin